ncbi:MAG: YdcF family protein [Planctomycetes bacterium]|nr:YdcF family protein [Planctomycetota bacterium]
MPLTSNLALATLEWGYPPGKQAAQDVPMIVVLSGGMAYGDALVPESRLANDTVQRCFAAAEIYHAGSGSKLLLSGGKVNPSNVGPQLADAMKELMERLRVPADAMLLENTSRSTYENAVESARILKQHHVDKVILVTDAAHLPRATRCFRKQGIEVIPWGCRYRSRPLQFSPMLFVPHPSAAEGTEAAIHEWAGLAWYWLNGRI